MKLRRNLVIFLSVCLLGVMVSAQAAFATRPCMDATMSAAAALAQQGEHDCCDTTVASLASVCLAKCMDRDKLSAHADLPELASHSEPVLTVDAPAAALPTPRFWRQASGLDPPKTIRFCTFLI